MSAPPVGAPEHLTAQHDVSTFDCGVSELDNMPEPIPVMVLGRLAVDRAHQGRGLGSALLKDALLRTLNAALIAGIRAVLLHSISDEAKRFYEKAGFSSSPVDPMTMMVTLADVEKALGGG